MSNNKSRFSLSVRGFFSKRDLPTVKNSEKGKIEQTMLQQNSQPNIALMKSEEIVEEPLAEVKDEKQKGSSQSKKQEMGADFQVNLLLKAKNKAHARRKVGQVFLASAEMDVHHEFDEVAPVKQKKRLFHRLIPALQNKDELEAFYKGDKSKLNRPTSAKHSKTPEQESMLREALGTLVLFNTFSNSTIDQIIGAMYMQTCRKGDVLFKLGDYGENFYIVGSGEFLVTKQLPSLPSIEQPAERKNFFGRTKSRKHKSQLRKKLGNFLGGKFNRASSTGSSASYFSKMDQTDFNEVENSDSTGADVNALTSHSDDFVLSDGQCFGELALRYGSPRERTVISQTNSTVWVLNRDIFSRIIQTEFLRTQEIMAEALKKINVLEGLHPEQLETLLEYAELVSFPKGKVIIEKGNLAGTFYMIVSGKVDCIVYTTEDEKEKDSSLSVNRDSSVLHIESSFQDLQELAAQDSDLDDSDGMSIVEKPDIAEVVQPAPDADKVQPVSDKQAKRTKMKRQVFTLSEGQYFGERGLIQKNRKRNADVIADTDVELLAITYDTISQHLGGLLRRFEDNIRMQALEDAPFFEDLSRTEKEGLQRAMKIEKFEDNQYIIREGEENNNFFILRLGEAVVKGAINKEATDDVEISLLREKNYFGEGTILSDKVANASVVARGKVECYVLDRENFSKFVSKSKVQFLKEKFLERSRTTKKLTRKGKEEMLDRVPLKRLKPLRNLGSGCFGLVKLVELKDVDSLFALKMLEKGMVVKNKQEINVKNEKNILLKVDHPFIVKLYRTYKDDKYLYFLMELVQGGEMFQYLHNVRSGYLDNDSARFYVACVVDALDYLHKKRIVYRDLKPENLMIDTDGYAKVVDFGFAKELHYRTFTLCGTAQYLAPEILYNNGYGRSVDFWCLGVLIYELFTGTTPFKRRNRNELFQAIKYENRIRFSAKKWKNADDAKDLVCLLLHKHPKKRLGCDKPSTRGFKDVKDHKWFSELHFNKLYYKELDAPWVPPLKDAKDLSQFEEYDESDNPIQGKYDDKAGKDDKWKDF